MIRVAIETKLKAYSGQQALRVVREFEAGSIIKIFGPSGSGKTTLLKIIAGFVQPEKGSIVVDGITWLDTHSKISMPPQKRKTGFVFQDYALFPNMTVHEHMTYAASDEAWIGRLLKIGKLETFVAHKPEYLSGGQQQRLAILRALAIKPKLLLMDEPFSALDPKMRSELISDLKLLFTELGTTVLIVSHYPQELEGLTEHELNIH
ncbi:MAG: potA [Mucilaginibacter sp.]|nr:potA [Mucilaginibacter sp.]